MILAQVAVTGIAFLSSVAFANMLSMQAYGNYQYILSVAEFIMAFSLTGMGTAVVRSVAKGYDGTLSHAFRQNLRWSILVVLIGIGTSAYYAYKENIFLAYGVLIASILSPIITSSKFYLSFLNGKKLFGKTGSYSVIGYLLPTIILVGTLFFTKNLYILIAIYFVSHAAVNLILNHFASKSAENNKIHDETIPFAKHLSFQNLIVQIAGQLDKIVLFQTTGAAALAEYMFAMSVPRQFQHLFKRTRSIVLPKISERPYAELRMSLPRKVGLLYVFIIPAIIGYVIVAPYVFELFFPQYISAVLYSQVYSLIFLLLPISLFTDVFMGHAKHKVLYKDTIIISLFKIVITLVLVPLYGIWGVLASLLITQTSKSFLTIYYFWKIKE